MRRSSIIPAGASLSTQAASGTAPSGTTANGNITAIAGGNATVRGFKYGLTQTDTWDVHEDGSFAAGTYSLAITGLSPSTTYYVRTYATNPEGTSYGNWVSFTTGIYYSSGTITSTNILSGQEVNIINSFDYNLSAKPSGTGATVQFSQNGTSWYNSAGVLDGTNTLNSGANSISLTSLRWSGANFYYKIQLTANASGSETPVLDEATVYYNINSSPASPTAATQLKNDAATGITNQGYTNETNVKLRASAADVDTTETLTLFFEAIANADSFTSPATPTTGTSCATGTAYADCASKIWYITSNSGDYWITPYTGTVNVTGLSHGTSYKWQVKACDDDSACSSWVAFNATTPNFTVDTVAPTVSITALSPDPNNDNTPTIAGTATDATSVLTAIQYQMDGTGGPWTTCIADDLAIDELSETFTCTPSTLADGSHTIYVRATDNATNTTALANYGTDAFTIDVTNPSVSLTALSPDPNNDNTPTISGTATDATSVLTAIQYQMDSTAGSWTTCTADDLAIDELSETFTCTPSALADGSHTIYVRATDNSTNTTALVNYATDTFAIDATNPLVSLTALDPDPNKDNTPTLSGTVTDATGTISAVQFQMDSTSGSWTACTADDGVFDEASETFTCTTSVLADGGHTMYVRSTDNSSNTSTSVFDVFVIDSTSPFAFDLDKPANESYTNQERPIFKWKSVADPTSGLDKYTLEIDNGETGDFSLENIPAFRVSDFETSTYFCTYENFADFDLNNNYISCWTKASSSWGGDNNDGKLKEGKRGWRVRAIDHAGNTKEEARTLYVDKTGPKMEGKINDLVLGSASNDNYSGSSQPTARSAGTSASNDRAVYSSNPAAGGVRSFLTTDQTPTFSGKIIDFLSNQVTSGPGSLEIKLEKEKAEGLGSYQLYSLYKLTFNKFSTADDGSKAVDFIYSLAEPLAFGNYKITLNASDKADNRTSLEFNLKIGSLWEITTPEEQETIKKTFEEMAPEITPSEKFKIQEGLEITKEGQKETPETLQEIQGKLRELLSIIFDRAVEGFNLAFNLFKKTGQRIYQLAGSIIWQAVVLEKNIAKVLAKGQVLLSQGAQFLANQYQWLAEKAPFGIAQGMKTLEMLAINIKQTISEALKTTDQLARGLLKTLEENGQQKITKADKVRASLLEPVDEVKTKTLVSLEMLYVYWFDKRATTIDKIGISETGRDYVVIYWKTNHYTKNNKVNYGEDTGYKFHQNSPDYKKHHEVKITGLKPGTKYYFEVMSQNKNYIFDAHHDFTTKD